MSSPPKDPSIEHEPHLRAGGHAADASEARAAATLDRERRDDGVERSVWDEPALSRELVGDREGDYARWLSARRAQTTAARSWLVTLLAAISAGPFAVIGVLLGPGRSMISLLAITVFGPVAEEMMKVAVPLYLVEKRPYLFRTPAQIVICGLASGLVFAALENLLYLHVYVPDPSPMLAAWRWSVCVLLHSGCTAINSLGLQRIWRDAWERLAPPAVALGFPYAAVAAGVHGVYNGIVVLLSLAEYRF